MFKIKLYLLPTYLLVILLWCPTANAQTVAALNRKQKTIVLVSAFTAKGELTKLKQALDEGLNAGLTINESKEVLVHLYAYCGFPRSIQGLNTLMTVLDERKSK